MLEDTAVHGGENSWKEAVVLPHPTDWLEILKIADEVSKLAVIAVDTSQPAAQAG